MEKHQDCLQSAMFFAFLSGDLSVFSMDIFLGSLSEWTGPWKCWRGLRKNGSMFRMLRRPCSAFFYWRIKTPYNCVVNSNLEMDRKTILFDFFPRESLQVWLPTTRMFNMLFFIGLLNVCSVVLVLFIFFLWGFH